MRRFLTGAAAAAIAAFGVTAAQAEGLPKNFTVTAYGTQSSGYAAMVAVGNAIADEGYKLSVKPAKNDISRMIPLKNKRVEFSAMGVGSFQAQEAVRDFGKPKWGPQPVRLLANGWGANNNGLIATAGDAGIKSAYDLKGKRMAWIVGGPALNQHMTAWLAFGNLTWDDVEKVEFGGWSASIQGMIDGTVDAAVASSNSSKLFQVESSPRGLAFFPAKHDDKEGWARLVGQAPWLVPHFGTAGVGLSEENKLEGATFGYPVLITYDWLSDDAVYELLSLMHKHYDKYKDVHASAAGFELKRQQLQWVMPIHNGAIRFYKEQNKWSDADQAHTDNLLKKQDLLMTTWNASGKGADYDVWMKARAEALDAAGYDPVWRK
jgi:TRAP transporter TAXI family solute receptor